MKLYPMRFLITGGAGFIGSHLCETLLKQNHEVVCFDNLSTGKIDNIKPFMGERFEFIQGDSNKLRDIKKAFKDIDYVFHYAATVGVRNTLENPHKVLNDIEGIKNILELSRKHSIKKIVFSSSSEVYGEATQIPESEDKTPLNVQLPYAAVKIISENFFRSYFEQYHLRTTNLRFFNVYGPRQNDHGIYGFVVGIFMKQVLADKPPTVFGNGLRTRDFTFIKDNVDASLMCLDNKKSDGESINIGTGRETTILELANEIIKISGKNLKPVFLPDRKKGDMWRRCPDITKMKDILNYTPKISLHEGLKKTYEWYLSSS